MSIVEAMRAGLPVVSTRAPVGPEEIITDGVDGLLTPVADVQAITDAILNLVLDVPRRRRMAAAAVDSSVRYDPQVVAARYEDVFKQLLSKKFGAETTPRRTLSSWRGRGAQSLKKWARARARPPRQVAGLSQGFTCKAFLRPSGAVVLELEASTAHGSAPISVNLRDRNDRAKERGVDLPLTRMTQFAPMDAARWCATLPEDTHLAESRWNVYTTDSSGESHRVRYSFCDLRHAAEVAASEGASVFSRCLPYGTRDGFLALRSWLRGNHAECDSVEIGDAYIIFVGRFMWPRAANETTQFIARPRQIPDVEVLGVALPTNAGEDFRFALPVDQLAIHRSSRHDDWDLYLECSDVEVPVRLSRLADDVVERKAIYQFPSVRCEIPETELADEWPTPSVIARPYVTVDSDLSIFVRET
jgi:hypothetical protein